MTERKPIILELGCGYGGSYIEQFMQFGINFVALDHAMYSFVLLKKSYPQVMGVCANAKNLPFPSNSVTKLLIQFPHKSILDQGLQPKSTSTKAQGWFKEFSRVLKTGSKLEIIGDFFLNPDIIIKTASKYFKLGNKVKTLSTSFLQELGTDESLDLLAESNSRPEILKICPIISLIKK